MYHITGAWLISDGSNLATGCEGLCKKLSIGFYHCVISACPSLRKSPHDGPGQLLMHDKKDSIRFFNNNVCKTSVK